MVLPYREFRMILNISRRVRLGGLLLEAEEVIHEGSEGVDRAEGRYPDKAFHTIEVDFIPCGGELPPGCPDIERASLNVDGALTRLAFRRRKHTVGTSAANSPADVVHGSSAWMIVGHRLPPARRQRRQ